MDSLVKDPIKFECFFPDEQILKSIDKHFKIKDAINNIEKNYCIGYLGTEIYLNSHFTFLVSINEKEFFGFCSLAYPQEFKYYPFKSFDKEEFIKLIQRRISPLNFSENKIREIVSKIEKDYSVIIEKQQLEQIIETQKIGLKIKI
jgi:hypothetical protein